MHSFLVVIAFLLMLLSPCVVAQCSSIFPIRLRIRWASSSRKTRTTQTIFIQDPAILRHDIHPSRQSGSIARHSRAA